MCVSFKKKKTKKKPNNKTDKKLNEKEINCIPADFWVNSYLLF